MAHETGKPASVTTEALILMYQYELKIGVTALLESFSPHLALPDAARVMASVLGDLTACQAGGSTIQLAAEIEQANTRVAEQADKAFKVFAEAGLI